MSSPKGQHEDDVDALSPLLEAAGTPSLSLLLLYRDTESPAEGAIDF